MLHAWVFDVARLSTEDGPGVRTTVFFQGCPSRCAWCHNPESQEARPHLIVNTHLCIGCHECKKVCPNGLEGPCTSCFRCAEVCPTGARRVAGREMAVAELLNQTLRDRHYYNPGGVTFSGGEPLVQWEASRELARLLRLEGVHVAWDTSGFASPHVLEELPDFADLVILDLKAASPEVHKRWTGVSNSKLLQALPELARSLQGRFWISIPFVPEVHTEQEVGHMIDIVRCLAGPPPVRLLPYHRLGEDKYGQLGMEPPRFRPPTEEELAAVAERFRSSDLTVLSDEAQALWPSECLVTTPQQQHT